MSGVGKMVEYFRALDVRDLTGHELLLLKAEAFEACAADSLARGDARLAEDEVMAARRARRAAEGLL